MYFTDRKAVLGYRPFFYRGQYFCNYDSYNGNTWQAHVFGADKSSAKIWYCVTPRCLFYRPERNLFGHPSVNDLKLAQFCPKFLDLLTICIGREVTENFLKVIVDFWYWNFFGTGGLCLTYFYGIMILFSKLQPHSLEISNPYIVKCVFYRLESQFQAIFFIAYCNCFAAYYWRLNATMTGLSL